MRGDQRLPFAPYLERRQGKDRRRTWKFKLGTSDEESRQTSVPRTQTIATERISGSNGMKKLLLTSVCRPLGPRYGDGKSVGYELMHGQVTRAQGIFSLRSIIHHFSLEYTAHNLDTPTIVLQYPSEKEFIRELKQGYDFVGISFVLSTFHRMKRMVALVRKHSPNSKIILGGYGTVLSDQE